MHDIRKSWKIIKIILGYVSHKDKIENIILGDQIFTEPMDTANNLIVFFSIAENLDSDLPPSSRSLSDFIGP